MPFRFSSACGKSNCRSRPSVSSALPDTIGSLSVPLIRADTSARPELRRLGTNPWRTARLAAPFAWSASVWSRQVDGAGELDLGLVADELERIDLEHLPIDADVNRPIVAQAIVEKLHFQPIDGGVDAQGVRVVELADHPDGAAGHGRGEGGRSPAAWRGSTGSSDVSVTWNDSSASISSFSSTRPVPDTASRADAASNS